MVPKDLPKPSESDLLRSAGVSPAVFGVPPNTRRRPVANPLGETPSGATERSELDSQCTVSVLVALPEITHFQSHPLLPPPGSVHARSRSKSSRGHPPVPDELRVRESGRLGPSRCSIFQAKPRVEFIPQIRERLGL